MTRRVARGKRSVLGTLILALACCSRSGKQSPASGAPGDQATPPARAIRVEPDSVVLEGHWQPVGGSAVSSVRVSVTCARSQRRCREELTSVGEGTAAAKETLQYAIREWTPRKLVAARQASGRDVELRVAFTAVQAEKAVIEKRSGKTVETRWRLE